MASQAATYGIQPLSPTPQPQFRFLDLPGELRNKIYEELLCNFATRDQTKEEHYADREDKLQLYIDGPPSHITYLQHSIEPQILSTCRSVYREGTHILFQINYFVKLTIKLPDVYLQYILDSTPLLYTTKTSASLFKHAVLSHKISQAPTSNTTSISTRSIIFLYRDIELFRTKLMEHLIVEGNIRQSIRLLDPCKAQLSTDRSIFLTRKLQEQLLAPYQKMRSCSYITIRGAVATEISRAVISQMRKSWIGNDPERVLAEIAEMKFTGERHCCEGLGKRALEVFCTSAFRCCSLLGTEGKRRQQMNKVDFRNRIVALLFDLWFNSAQVTLRQLKILGQKYEFYRMIGQCHHCHVVSYPRTTWKPSPQQMRNVLHLEAEGSRIIKDFNRALESINMALDIAPGDVELKRERERIIQAMS